MDLTILPQQSYEPRVDTMRVTYICFLAGIVVSVVASVMFGRDKRGLKRSRRAMLDELQPGWWVDARTRKSLRKLLALNDDSPDWSDHVRADTAADYGRHYLCSECGNAGAHVLSWDLKLGMRYRCLECGGDGVVMEGGVCGSGFGFGGSSHGEQDAGSACAVDSCGSGEEEDSEYLPDEGGDEDSSESDLLGSLRRSGDGGGVRSVGEIDSDDEVSRNGNADNGIPVLLKFCSDVCDNCHRKDTGTRNQHGHVDNRSVRLSQVWLGCGSFQRRFATMKYGMARATAAAVN